jgi:HEXXH motif-containing protein
MKLDERFWIGAGGLTPQWRWVMQHRVKDALTRLKNVAAGLQDKAPAEVRKRDYLAGLRYFLDRGGADRDRLAVHPAVDYWLFLWGKHFLLPCTTEDWHLQLGLFQGIAAGLALARGDKAEFDSTLDPDGRLYLYGTPYGFAFSPEFGRRPVRLVVKGDRLTIEGPGKLKTSATLKEMAGASPDGTACGPARIMRSLEVRPGVIVEDRAWLLTHGVTMHGLAKLKTKEKERFAAVLDEALAAVDRQDPAFAAEFSDMMRVLVPLENPMKFGSVSSSYVNMRGAIGLSHSEDPLLQVETLLHEFCHQKMNQLLIVEPILLPGQSGQVFYSPWRKDARRLRGLLLGAHAFLNVAAHLLRFLRAEDGFKDKERIDVMLNIAQRLYQVEAALRCVSFYGSLTEFGESFVMGMWHDLGLLFHGIQWFPAALLKEARDHCAEHRAAHALFETGFHKGEDLVDKVERAPFLTPGGVEAGVKTSVE